MRQGTRKKKKIIGRHGSVAMPAKPQARKQKKALKPQACPKCGQRGAIRSGFAQGEQRWKCKECTYQFTRTRPRGRPLWQKSLVVFLYSYGLSMRSIASIFHVQPSTVFKWVRSYAKDHQPVPEAGDIMIMELNDMHHHLEAASKENSATLCIAINDATFRKSMGITITGK